MTALDEIIHQSVRLQIMGALNALPRDEATEFTRLRAITGATDGNLGAHLATLENAGYIAVNKEGSGRKSRTTVTLTRAGKKAFEKHVAYLRDIMDGSAAEDCT